MRFDTFPRAFKSLGEEEARTRPPPGSASSPRIRLCYGCTSAPSGTHRVFRNGRHILDRFTLPCLPAAAISWHLVVVLALSCSSSHACRQALQA